MSRHADDFTESAVADLQYEFGDALTRYPLRDMGAGEPITGVFVESASDGLFSMLAEGDQISRSGTFELSVDATTDDRDLFLIRGILWFVKNRIPSDGQIQILQLESVEKFTHKAAPRK